MVALSIGQVAKSAGVNVQTLRYYEREGIIPPPKRSSAGYRQYPDDAVRVVIFIKRAQELGFTLKEAKALLKLRSAGPRRRDSARNVAEAKIRDIDAKLRDLSAMRAALESLVGSCACASSTIECPILESLENRPTEA